MVMVLVRRAQSWVALFMVWLLSACGAPPTVDVEVVDLLIIGGRVMDPESGLDAVRQVAIRDGEIVAVIEDGGRRFEAIEVLERGVEAPKRADRKERAGRVEVDPMPVGGAREQHGARDAGAECSRIAIEHESLVTIQIGVMQQPELLSQAEQIGLGRARCPDPLVPDFGYTKLW